MAKIFFSTLLSSYLHFFVLHRSQLSNALYLLEIFTNSILSLHLSVFMSFVSHKLFASLSRLGAMNQQLSMNLN